MLKIQKLDSCREKKTHKFLDFFAEHLLLALVKKTNKKITIKRCTPPAALCGISASSYLSKYQERISWVKFFFTIVCKMAYLYSQSQQ